MMKEKDPTVMALMKRYNNVPMPNLKLDDHDVAEVIEYIAQETARHRASMAKGPTKHDAGTHRH